MLNRNGSQRSLEIMLVLICAVLTCVLYRTMGYKIIVLNLFYLPVILAAFYLGRYRAGVLAFFSVISASIVTSLTLGEFAAFVSPVVIGLSIVVWGAVLGLTAIMVGTLSDELSTRLVELHEAHVGVVEVLARYLQSAHPRLKTRSRRVSDLCRDVAVQMKLSAKEVDDVHVAALLHDMENIEITARVIKKAIGDLEGEQKGVTHHTFHGAELVHSLGPVLSGAIPLLLNQADAEHASVGAGIPSGDVPFGARIIRTVRAYDALIDGAWGGPGHTTTEALQELRRDAEADHHPAVLHALEKVVGQSAAADRILAAAESKPVGAL
ncbi:MAG: HD-GYP domain-containing protein [Planctomycetaceae bacterium]